MLAKFLVLQSIKLKLWDFGGPIQCRNSQNTTDTKPCLSYMFTSTSTPSQTRLQTLSPPASKHRPPSFNPRNVLRPPPAESSYTTFSLKLKNLGAESSLREMSTGWAQVRTFQAPAFHVNFNVQISCPCF